jgi:hypothetical protein
LPLHTALETADGRTARLVPHACNSPCFVARDCVLVSQVHIFQRRWAIIHHLGMTQWPRRSQVTPRPGNPRTPGDLKRPWAPRCSAIPSARQPSSAGDVYLLALHKAIPGLRDRPNGKSVLPNYCSTKRDRCAE